MRVLAAVLAVLAAAQAAGGEDLVRPAVVKVRCVYQSPSYFSPWKLKKSSQRYGSGVIIEEGRILTSAHVVSDARYIEITRENDPEPHRAEIAFIAHDCDLALLQTDDPALFDGVEPIPLGEIPPVQSMVFAYGYPVGGGKISITRGVVSRIDYGIYRHSAYDAHLILQIDAALNPGNSGGPVIQDGKLVGISFQVFGGGENIGYAIPTTVIGHFLTDVEDGVYEGYPEIGILYQKLINPTLRESVALPEGRTGVLISKVLEGQSAAGKLLPGDLLLEVDGRPVRNNGTILVDGEEYNLAELAERKWVGDPLELTVYRGGEILKRHLRLTNPPLPVNKRNAYEARPEYFIYAGLVFEPLCLDYIKTWGRDWGNRADKRLLYLFHYYFIDDLYLDREEVVVLVKRLPAPVNAYYTGYRNRVVKTVNGIRFRTFPEFIEAFNHPQDGFQVIEFEGSYPPIVLDAEEAAEADPTILRTYGIPSDRLLDAERREGDKG